MESFNGKLRDELLNGELFSTLSEAQVVIEHWRRHYNTQRPHSALGYRPPAPETVAPMSCLSAELNSTGGLTAGGRSGGVWEAEPPRSGNSLTFGSRRSIPDWQLIHLPN